MDVFYSDYERVAYSQDVIRYSRVAGVFVLAYCMMTNHVHFLLVPETVASLHDLFQRLHTRHAQRINLRNGYTGHLWQNRFFSCVLDEAHFWSAVHYIENNPVRAGMVKQAWEYSWSSARARCEGMKDPLLRYDDEWGGMLTRLADAKGFLSLPHLKKKYDNIRITTKQNRAAGSREFLADLAQRLDRNVAPKAQGRPRQMILST